LGHPEQRVQFAHLAASDVEFLLQPAHVATQVGDVFLEAPDLRCIRGSDVLHRRRDCLPRRPPGRAVEDLGRKENLPDVALGRAEALPT